MGKSVTSPPKKAQPFDGVVNTSTITVAQSPIGMRMCKLDILEERNNTNCRLSLSGGMSASTHACAHTHTQVAFQSLPSVPVVTQAPAAGAKAPAPAQRHPCYGDPQAWMPWGKTMRTRGFVGMLHDDRGGGTNPRPIEGLTGCL